MSILAAAILLAGAAAATPPEALLLGVRSSDNSLATYLVDGDGFHRMGDGLAVPRKDGFWKVDVSARTVHDGYTEHLLGAAPAGKPKPLPAPESDIAECTLDDAITVLFVAPDTLSYEYVGGGNCEHAAHPWNTDVLRTIKIEHAGARGSAERPIAIGNLLGRPAVSALARDGARAKAKIADEDLRGCLDEPDEQQWALIRSKGRWIVRATFPEMGRACNAAQGQIFTVDTGVSEKVTGPDTLPKPWESIVREHAGALDAVGSPSGSLLVTVTKDAALVEVRGKKAGTLDVKGASIVMAQWATGSAVARWKTDAAAALAK